MSPLYPKQPTFTIDRARYLATLGAADKKNLEEMNDAMQRVADRASRELLARRIDFVNMVNRKLAVMIGLTLSEDEQNYARCGWEALARQWVPANVEQMDTLLQTNYFFRKVRDSVRIRWNVAMVMLGLPEVDLNVDYASRDELIRLADDSIYAKIIDLNQN